MPNNAAISIVHLTLVVPDSVLQCAIYKAACAICKQLQDSGYEGWLVGGMVRDLILQPHKPPTDCDIATNALPDQVAELFPRSGFVGKSFGVSLVRKEKHSFEVTTFRKDGHYSDGRHPDSVSFGSQYDDSCRRDFTINALYYDPIQKRLCDFHSGLIDAQNLTLKAVGAPNERFKEDALRILRMARFAAGFHLKVEKGTLQGARDEILGLKNLSRERILLEVSKLPPGSFGNFLELLSQVSQPSDLDSSLSSQSQWLCPSHKLFLPNDFHQRFPLSSLFLAVGLPENSWQFLEDLLPSWPATRQDSAFVRSICALERLLLSDLSKKKVFYFQFFKILQHGLTARVTDISCLFQTFASVIKNPVLTDISRGWATTFQNSAKTAASIKEADLENENSDLETTKGKEEADLSLALKTCLACLKKPYSQEYIVTEIERRQLHPRLRRLWFQYQDALYFAERLGFDVEYPNSEDAWISEIEQIRLMLEQNGSQKYGSSR